MGGGAWVRGGGGQGWGVQGGWEWRNEAFVKMQKKKKMVGGWGGGGEGVLGGQGGWEWRNEAFVKMQKKKIWWGGGGLGVRVDGNGEMKLL